MARLWPTYWAVPLITLLLGVAAVGLLAAPAHAQQSGSSSGPSWTESVTSPFKQGFDKLGRALTPPKTTAVTPGPEDDAVSLKSKAKPGPELFVAVARLYEQSGKLAEAEQQYQMALKQRPNDLPALLGYAHLKDYRGQPNEAIQLYQRAAKAHPQEASVHNNLGLCYARQNRLDEAAAAMSRAIQFDSANPLYRNNIATVLVDQGKWFEAFGQLRAVHGNAAAYYNVGYLLHKKGQTEAALQNFTLALKTDPSMDAARRWVDYLQRTTTQARLPQHPTAAGVKILNMSPEQANASPGEPTPRRLPSTMRAEPSTDGSSRSGISYESPVAPAAPFPPQSTNSALRPLPRVN